VKLTFSVLEDHSQDKNRHWPSYLLGGRIRTSTLVLIVAFVAVWWTYDTYRPPAKPSQPPVQVVPPGFLPDPNYTWVPRTQVQQSPPTYYTPTPTPTTAVPTTTPPPTTTTTTTTTPPPLFQLPVLPPPFGPGTTTPAPPGTSETAPPGPTPAPGPLPGLPGFGR
jgi:hypothetical protein